MKKVFYLTVFCVVFIVNLKAQDLDNFWEALPFPSNTSLTEVVTNSRGDIFVAFHSGIDYYEDGGVFRSTDGGYTWDYVYQGKKSRLNRIAINDSGYIYTTARSSEKLVFSKDNGETWNEISLPTEARGNIIKIFCHGKDTLFVSTWEDNGAFISVSFDNGETWNTNYLTNGTSDYITDIAVSSENEFYVTINGFVNGRGGVYKSVDGGITWDFFGLIDHQLFAVEINQYDDIFVGAKEGGGLCVLYHDTTSFQYLTPYITPDIAISSDNVICTIALNTVMLSYDNGKTFIKVTDPLTSGIKALHISANNHLYGAGAINCNLIRSLDPVVQTSSTHSNLLHQTKVYPNPATNIININTEQFLNKEISSVVITDISGRQMKVSSVNDAQIDISNLNEGTYIITVLAGDKVYRSKFLVTR
ncbi:MAG: T9SS type A sorting domain-containing protein [Bacteroidales bacterium]|jgi:hypothetical protein